MPTCNCLHFERRLFGRWSSLSLKNFWTILQLYIYVAKNLLSCYICSVTFTQYVQTAFRSSSMALSAEMRTLYYTARRVSLLFQHIPVVTSRSPSLVLKPRLALFLISYTWFSLALLLLPDSEKRAWPIKSVFTWELFYNAAECYTQMNKTSPLTLPRRGWHHKSRRDLLS